LGRDEAKEKRERKKKEEKVEQQKDSERFGRVLIIFQFMSLKRTKTEGLEHKKAQAVNLDLLLFD